MDIKRLFFCLFLNSHLAFSDALSFSVQDKMSLQKGAKLYMNYCSGCHSLKYLRYNRMAEDLGLMQYKKIALRNTQTNINDPIQSAMPPEDAKQWFGTVPPDLSLIAREKGGRWLYTYLTGFYKDNSRPFGTNNSLIPNVAMPDILESLTEESSEAQYRRSVQDLVGFLVYVGEPMQSTRHHLGFFVLCFLFIFLLVVWQLKTVYSKKVV